jgi:hypothetical protein
LPEGVSVDANETFDSIISSLQAELVAASNAEIRRDSVQSTAANPAIFARLDISSRAAQPDILIRLRHHAVVDTNARPQGLLVNINVNGRVRERHMLMRTQVLAGMPQGLVRNYRVSSGAAAGGQRQMREVAYTQQEWDDSFVIRPVDDTTGDGEAAAAAARGTDFATAMPADEVARWSGIVRVLNIDL